MRATLAGLLVLLAVASAAAETRTLILEHRSGAELEPLLRPLAGQGVGMVVDGQRLVLQGEADRLDAVAQAARALDHPPRDLWLRLRRPSGLPGDPSESRRHATADPRAVSLRLREGETVSWDRAVLHQVTGDRALAAGRRGPLLLEEGRPLWLHQGLRARVQVVGERFVAHLETAADLAGEEDPRRDRLATTVSGPLGRWVAVQTPGAAPPDPEVRRPATRPTGGSGLELRVDPAGP